MPKKMIWPANGMQSRATLKRVGRSVCRSEGGRRGVGGGVGRRTDGTFYFSLEPPCKAPVCWLKYTTSVYFLHDFKKRKKYIRGSMSRKRHLSPCLFVLGHVFSTLMHLTLGEIFSMSNANFMNYSIQLSRESSNNENQQHPMKYNLFNLKLKKLQ